MTYNPFKIILETQLRSEFMDGLRFEYDNISDWYSMKLAYFEVLYVEPHDDVEHYIFVVPYDDYQYPIYEVELSTKDYRMLHPLAQDIMTLQNNYQEILLDLLHETGFYDTIKLQLEDYLV